VQELLADYVSDASLHTVVKRLKKKKELPKNIWRRELEKETFQVHVEEDVTRCNQQHQMKKSVM